MTRKFLVVLISAVMLLSVSLQSVYASDYQFKEDFTDSGTSAGIGGKAADDKSINTKQDIYNIIELSDVVTFEYNLFHTTDYLNHLRFVYTTEAANNVTTNIFDTNGSGKLKFRPQINKVYSIPDNKWIRIALTFNPAEASDNLTFYLNGEEMGVGTIPLPKNELTKLRSVFDLSKDYIDDVAVYYGSYNMPSSPNLSLNSATATVNNESSSVEVCEMPVTELRSKLSVSDGAEFVSVVDSETYLAKPSTELVKSGDKLLICASDAMTYYYYTITTFGQYYSETFNSASSSGEDFSLPGDLIVSGAPTQNSVGGKLSDDVSINLSSEQSTIQKTVNVSDAYAAMSVEYSILLENAEATSKLSVGDENVFPKFANDGKVILEDSDISSYAYGRWHRVGIDINPLSGTYNYYFNGTSIAENVPFENTGDLIFKFVGAGAYIDDIKIYVDSYSFVSAPEAIAKGSARLDDTNMQIALYNTVDASEITDFVEIADDGIISVVDFTNSTTKTGGKINIGDLIAASSDGVIYNYYTVADKIPEDFDAIKCTMISDGQPVVISDITPGMNVSFEYTMQNKTTVDKNGYLVIAVYENEALVYFDIQLATVSAGSTLQTNPTDCIKKSKSDYVAKEKPDHIEVQFWKSMTERTPLLKTYKFN